MGLLTLTSTNPNLSYLLRKNPARTRMMAKPLGKGTLFGWYDKRDPQHGTFVAYFRDGENEVTFRETPDNTFDYLSTLRYTSPRFVLAACTLLFKEAMRPPSSLDEKKTPESSSSHDTLPATPSMLLARSIPSRYLVHSKSAATSPTNSRRGDEITQTPTTSPVDDVKSPIYHDASGNIITERITAGSGILLSNSIASSSSISLNHRPVEEKKDDDDNDDDDDPSPFTTSLQGQQDTVGAFQHTLTINLIHICSRGMKFLERCRKFLIAFEVVLAYPGTHVYKLTLTTKESLVHLLNTTFLLCAFFASFNRHVWQFDKTMCERLISIMHTSDVPYYVRYRFVGQFLNRTTFPKMCAALTSRPSKHYESVVFHEGTTADHRRDMIRGLLDFKRPILEIGCGEGFYTVPFAQRVNPLPLVAIDVDETILAQTRHKCATKNLTNVSFHPSLDAFLDATSKVQERDKTVYDIICSEVVEHMPQKDAEKLITQVMEHVAFRSFIITTPNSDFNRFYELSPEEMRHDDHDFELGTIEFQAWINKLLAPFASASCTWKFVPVGDIVDGVACSHGLIITRQ